MPFVAANDIQLAYEEAGSGPPVILLHAGIVDRRMWRDVMPAFAAHFRTIALDHRAYGETLIPDGRFSWTADLLALMDALSVGRAHLVAVSMSCRVALDLALAHPDRVGRLVLVAGGIPGWEVGEALDAAEAAEEDALKAGDLEEAAWVEVRTWLDGPERTPGQVDPDLRRRVFEMQLRAYEIDNETAELYWLVDDPRARYGEITAPTLVLVGELDQGAMQNMSRALADEIPSARFESLHGVAHLPPMEDPSTFARLATEFLLET